MLQVIAAKMEKGVQRYLIVRNENASKNYTTTFVQQLFSEEGKGEVRQTKVSKIHSSCFRQLNNILYFGAHCISSRRV